MKPALVIAILICCITPDLLNAQDQRPLVSYARTGKGVGVVDRDSTFSLNFQFRIQNRAAFMSKSDRADESFEFRVRRLRLKFEGFAYNPKLTYYIQLSFSRGDMDWNDLDESSVNSSPNVIRDAVIYYQPNERFKFGFGQTKLPGNRQRVVSSGDLQFADRSIVNATFNIDRDFGFFAHYTTPYYNLNGAITSGEGRNAVMSGRGLHYTGRAELLPLGSFTGDNDYVEGDLAREPKPKASIGITYSYNANAVRQAGVLGNDLFGERNLRTFAADVLVKLRGWAWYTEYMSREANNPITVDPLDLERTRLVYVGRGFLSQLSYIFPGNFEIAGRYAVTTPSSRLYNNPEFPTLSETQLEQAELGVTQYLRGHRVKVQGNLIFGRRSSLQAIQQYDDFWSAVFQFEIGI